MKSLVVAFLALVGLGFSGLPSYYLVLLGAIFFWIAQTTSWNLLSGYAGYFSFGQAAYVGVGAYATAVLTGRHGVSFFWSVPVAAVLCGLLALGIGAVAFRLGSLRGEIFALLTLAVPFILSAFARINHSVDGGQGTTVPPPTFADFQELQYLLALVVAAIAVAVAYVVQHGRAGSALTAIRDDEDVAEVLGVPTFRYKMVAIAAGGVLGGIGGSVYALQIGFVTVESVFGLTIPLFVIVMGVLGGRSHWLGPVIGATLIVSLQDRLSAHGLDSWNAVILGGILALLVVAAPAGLYARLRARPVVAGVAFALVAGVLAVINVWGETLDWIVCGMLAAALAAIAFRTKRSSGEKSGWRVGGKAPAAAPSPAAASASTLPAAPSLSGAPASAAVASAASTSAESADREVLLVEEAESASGGAFGNSVRAGVEGAESARGGASGDRVRARVEGAGSARGGASGDSVRARVEGAGSAAGGALGGGARTAVEGAVSAGGGVSGDSVRPGVEGRASTGGGVSGDRERAEEARSAGGGASGDGGEAGGGTALVEIRRLAKHFGGVHALDEVTLDVRGGELVGLVGPNGSGKTTLVDLLSGRQRPTRGTIRVGGVDLGRLAPHEIAHVGMARTYQIPKPFGSMTVRDNVATAIMFGRRPVSLREARPLAEEHLGTVALEQLADAYPGNLNLHQRQLLEMARAIAAGPRVLLLDEALAGLNPAEVDNAVEVVRRIHRSGITIVLVEHLLRVLNQLATRIVVLDRGTVLADGDPRAVMSDPAVIRAYLGRQAHV
jgi:ABC-type branched-subunit amino acid transport system ATPase component/ABC-type branched-subunit amino acid transport system permease subunit